MWKEFVTCTNLFHYRYTVQLLPRIASMMIECYSHGQKIRPLVHFSEIKQTSPSHLHFFWNSVLPEHFKYLVCKPWLVCEGGVHWVGGGFHWCSCVAIVEFSVSWPPNSLTASTWQSKFSLLEIGKRIAVARKTEDQRSTVWCVSQKSKYRWINGSVSRPSQR